MEYEEIMKSMDDFEVIRNSFDSIWNERHRRWRSNEKEWKAVGGPGKIFFMNMDSNTIRKQNMKQNEIEGMFSYRKIYYSVVFTSGETKIGTCRKLLNSGDYVIVEADRGEDCAKIKEEVEKPKNMDDTRGIIRLATKEDISMLGFKKDQEEKALYMCIGLVKEKGYSMDITRCEYQWDMKKITFYFRSNKRIDFRDLIKELFKHFKIRIWMCMENKY